MDWDKELNGTADESWLKLKNLLLRLESKHVPLKKVGSKRKAIWMTHKAANLVRKRKRVYSKYKDPLHPAYLDAAEQAATELRKARRNFEKKLAKKIKNDTKSFYAYVRSRSSSRVKTGPLVNSDGTAMNSDEQMAEELNGYFASVFTEEDTTVLPDAEPIFTGSEEEILKNIEITEEIVAKYLFRLREDKASGADELSPRFLLSIANELVGP